MHVWPATSYTSAQETNYALTMSAVPALAPPVTPPPPPLPPSTGTGTLTKAKVYMGANDTFTVSDSGATLVGNLGANTVKIVSGVTGVKTDANFSRIELGGNHTDYKLVVVPGVGLQIQTAAGAAVDTIGSLNNDVTLAFADGSAPLTQTGITAFSLGGSAISTTPATVHATLNTADNSSFGAATFTKAKVYMGTGGDTFTVSDSGATLIGNLGIDTVKIASGVTGVKTDANFSRIELAGNHADYKLVVVPGVGLQIQTAAGVAVDTIASLNNDATLTFADGSSPLVQTGIADFTLGGLAVSTGTTVPPHSVNLPAAADIFRTQGSIGGGGSDTDIFNAGKIRVMADFAKAAYSLQAWENPVINDVKPYSADAKTAVTSEGWVPLPLNIASLPATSQVWGRTITNGMSGGYYTNGEAAAFVAKSGDSVVISFRGTNDNGDNLADTSHIVNLAGTSHAPDADVFDWFFMRNHYTLLQPLISAVDRYVSKASNNISHVYVTGHSLGGAMAINYMEELGQDGKKIHDGTKYEAVTFAAPGYMPSLGLSTAVVAAKVVAGSISGSLSLFAEAAATAVLTLGAAPDDSDRVTHIEINGDFTPDVGPHGGRTIHFEGDQTYVWITTPSNNHSMDYYRQITKSVDPDSWGRILAENGDQVVLLGGERVSYSDNNGFTQLDYIVDGTASGTAHLNDATARTNVVINSGANTLKDGTFTDYNVYYGGRGDDKLTGGNQIPGRGELMIGGPGHDTITTGLGDDRIYFGRPADGGDTITDFDAAGWGWDPKPGEDHILVNATNFGLITGTAVTLNQTASGTGAQFVYNSSDGKLWFDQNGTAGTPVLLATLIGHPTLTAGDFQVVAA